MKIKSLLVVLGLFIMQGAFAQKSMLNRGKDSYGKFNELKSVNTPEMGKTDLSAAIEALEAASEHSKTTGLSETWTFLALSYADMSRLEEDKMEEYTEKAIAALEKAKAGEGADAMAENMEVVRRILAQTANDQGVQAFQSQDYEKAYADFSQALEYLPGDTLLTFYAGLAAFNGQKFDIAIEKYEELLKVDDFSSLEDIYYELSRLYMIKEDTVKALENSNKGIERFPDSDRLKIQNIEFKLNSGKEAETISDIEKQIANNPEDRSLYYYLGLAQSAAENVDAAEAAYRKAIEIDPSFGEAYINLGGLMLNKGIYIFREASNLPTDKQQEYTEAMKKGNAAIDEAFPVLEKATQVNEESPIAWQNLRTYYQLKEDAAKIEEIDKILEAL